MKRAIVALSVLALLASASPASADPDPEQIACPRVNAPVKGGTFTVKGPGAFVGGWSADGKRANLCFRGAGGEGSSTDILATWTTQWSHRYEFAGAYDFVDVKPADHVDYVVNVRMQVRGDPWSSWFGMHQRSVEPIGGGSGGLGMGILFASPKDKPFHPPLIRWEFRLAVTITAPALVDMRANVG